SLEIRQRTDDHGRDVPGAQAVATLPGPITRTRRRYPFERNARRAAILYRPTCDVRALHPCDALPAGTARVLSWLAARPFRPSHSRCRMRDGRADARGARRLRAPGVRPQGAPRIRPHARHARSVARDAAPSRDQRRGTGGSERTATGRAAGVVAGL